MPFATKIIKINLESMHGLILAFAFNQTLKIINLL